MHGLPPGPEAQEYELPAAEALLAGTLALMTGYGQSDDAQTRQLMAARIARQLLCLSEQPQLSEPFRLLLARLQGAWHGPSCEPCAAPAAPPALWCATPSALQ